VQTQLEQGPPVVAQPLPEATGPRESRYLFAGIAVASIWIAVAAASIWSPDMITGSQHEHIPIAAFGDWFYAAIATGLVLMAFGRRTPGSSRSLWEGFAIAIAGIWLVVALASIYAPTMVTGTDPTTIPIAAFAAPIAGVIATAFVSVFAAGSSGRTVV
jgi:hypothetical protein